MMPMSVISKEKRGRRKKHRKSCQWSKYAIENLNIFLGKCNIHLSLTLSLSKKRSATLVLMEHQIFFQRGTGAWQVGKVFGHSVGQRYAGCQIKEFSPPLQNRMRLFKKKNTLLKNKNYLDDGW